jgi:hypothetical protein
MQWAITVYTRVAYADCAVAHWFIILLYVYGHESTGSNVYRTGVSSALLLFKARTCSVKLGHRSSLDASVRVADAGTR